MSIFSTIIIIFVLLKCCYAPTQENDGNSFKALHVRFKTTEDSRYLCPPDSEDDINLLKKLSNDYFELLKYCLFDKSFENGEQNKLCNSEVKLIFTPHFDEEFELYTCGFNKHQYLHFFGYFYCGENARLDDLRNVRNLEDLIEYLRQNKPKSITAYDVCFDTSKQKTIYTTHTVYHPWLYRGRNFAQHLYSPPEIDTEPFYIKRNPFIKIKKRYESQPAKNSSETNYRMVPYPLVPAEDFPIIAWKKTTNHYINRAPLREELVPLMTETNKIINQVAVQVFFEKSQRNEKLLIYTRTVDFPKSKFPFIGSFARWIKNEKFHSSIWYKLLYNEVKKQAVMIFIHNITTGKEEHLKKQCKDDMVIICDSLSIINGGIDSKYIYCCKITPQQAKEIFFQDFDIESVLNIDSMIKYS